MNASDEFRKTLTDPKPLYALVGAGDLAAEKLKDAPERLRDTSSLLAEAGATLTTIANRIAAEAPERISKLSTTVQDTTGKAVRPDTQALRGAAQSVALQQVGRLLEAAGKAMETYDELAVRGKVVVDRYTGGSPDTAPGEGVGVDDNGPVNVVVEQVLDEDDILDAPVETAEEAAEVFEAAAEAEEEIEREAAAAAKAAEQKKAAGSAAKAKPNAAKKTTSSTPRKRAASSTAPKTPRSPKA